MKAPIPSNEASRLEALRRYNILDTPAEQAFEDLAQLAAQVCGTPIALVSLVDSNRQWLKAKTGVSVTETARDVAFCAHAILNPDEVLCVRDASTDARFADNPFVTAEPRIRFYAGAPLVTEDGFALGTLCVIDRVPRELTPAQLSALKVLRRQVMRELDLRLYAEKLEHALADRDRAEDALRERDALLFDLLENASDLIQRVSLHGQFLYVNRAWRETLGYTDVEAATLSAFDIVHPDCREHCLEVFARVLDGETVDNFKTVFVTKGGGPVPLEGSVSCLFVKGKPIATRGIFRKITDQSSA